MNDKPLFQMFCNKIDTDFAILSSAARSELQCMIARMAEDAYHRGFRSGVESNKIISLRKIPVDIM